MRTIIDFIFQSLPIVILAALITAVSTIYANIRLLRDLQRSRAQEQLYRALNLFNDFRGDIEQILTLETKPFSLWTPDELQSAFNVCARFHMVGRLVIGKMVPDDVLAQTWFYSIPKCYTILRPFLDEIRRERDPAYWTTIDELVLRVLRNTEGFKGFHFDPKDQKELHDRLGRWEKTHSQYRAANAAAAGGAGST